MPDTTLLARVAGALGNDGAAEKDPAIVALRAKIGAILEAAEKSGALDEAALAELPTDVAEQMRTFWADRGN
jgi:hypothetical protein